MAKSSFNRQFKKGTMPQQHVYPETTQNQHEADDPSKMRKRNSVALGFQTQANPGLTPTLKKKKR